MTPSQQHAARLRDVERIAYSVDLKTSLLAGAEALEAQGRWRIGVRNGQGYMIPVGREDEWHRWSDNAEPGEYTSIVPEWAEAVPDDVVITGWERP